MIGSHVLRQALGYEESNPKNKISSDVNGVGSLAEDFSRLTEVFTTQEFEKLTTMRKDERIGAVSPLHSTLGFYHEYLLARPHPSLKVLFASPSLQSPQTLQQPLLDNIGGSARVRQDLARALEIGRKVTAKVEWLAQSSHSKTCWLHCTPLLGSNETIGVWMIFMVEVDSGDDLSQDATEDPSLRVDTLNGDQYAPNPTPWDTIHKNNTPSQVSIAIRNNGDANGQVNRDPLKATPNEITSVTKGSNRNPPDPKVKDIGEIESLSAGQKPIIEGSVQQTRRHDGYSGSNSSWPLTSRSNEGPKQHSESAVAAIDISGRSADKRRVGKPAPINMPGPPPLPVEEDSEGLRPVRKRTYKSLSPYGIIFDN